MIEQSRKRIAFAITKGNVGGAQKYLLDMAKSVSQKGFEPIVLMGEKGKELPSELEKENVPIFQINKLEKEIKPIKDFVSFLAIIKLLRKTKPDIIHLNSSKMGFLGSLAARIVGVPKIVFTAHGWAFNESRSFFSKLVFYFFHWLTIVFCHKVIAVSQKTAKDIGWMFGTKKKLVVIYNGIEKSTTHNGLEARNLLKPDLSFNTWIGTIAELNKNKGLDLAIEAFSKISEDYPDTAYVIIGNGSEKENLKKLIKEKNLKERILLVGYKKEASKYLKAFDIFVLPSRTEAFPYVLLESGLAEVPIVASNVGGVSEIINNKTGILTLPKPKEIYKSLDFALNNMEEADKRAQKLKSIIEKNFSTEKMVNETIKAYNS